MKTNNNEIYFYERYRKYHLTIDDKTKLFVRFTGLEGDLDFFYPRSVENSRKYISQYEILHKLEESIREEFFKNHQLPEGVSECIDGYGHTDVIFLLEGLFENHGYYEAVYNYASMAS